MTEGSPSLSVIALNVNVLNSPIKRQRMAEWIKHDPSIWCLQETHLNPKTQTSWKRKGAKWYSMHVVNKKRARVPMLISEKLGFK